MCPAHGPDEWPLYERVFDSRLGRVSNMCSITPRRTRRLRKEIVELILKVILVGYIVYAVFGAPMVTRTDADPRRTVR